MIKTIIKYFKNNKGRKKEMKKVLYIKSNPKEEKKSFSLQVGRKFIEEYKKLNPQDEVIEIDVYDDNIPLIDKDILSALDKIGNKVEFENLTKEEKNKLARFNDFTDKFIEADKYIFVTPMWNLGLPPMMKAYLDTVVVAGKTFKYTENGPVGLLNNKKALHIHASGGVYSKGEASRFEHTNSYIKDVINFIGVSDFENILVEGMAYYVTKADEIKTNAIEKALELAKTF